MCLLLGRDARVNPARQDEPRGCSSCRSWPRLGKTREGLLQRRRWFFLSFLSFSLQYRPCNVRRLLHVNDAFLSHFFFFFARFLPLFFLFIFFLSCWRGSFLKLLQDNFGVRKGQFGAILCPVLQPAWRIHPQEACNLWMWKSGLLSPAR